MGGIIDNLSGGFAVESFVGEADEMPVLNVPERVRSIAFPEGIIIAGIFGFEELLDAGDGHAIVICHDVVTHDIASLEASIFGGGSRM